MQSWSTLKNISPDTPWAGNWLIAERSPCYYAELIPTLFAVEAKLEALHDNNLSFCSHLRHAIVDGFQRRFGAFLELRPEVNEAILASVTHLYFKMRWLPPQMASKKKKNPRTGASGWHRSWDCYWEWGLKRNCYGRGRGWLLHVHRRRGGYPEDISQHGWARVTACFRGPKEGLTILGPVPLHQNPFCKVQYHHSVFCSSRAFIFLCWTDKQAP